MYVAQQTVIASKKCQLGMYVYAKSWTIKMTRGVHGALACARGYLIMEFNES